MNKACRKQKLKITWYGLLEPAPIDLILSTMRSDISNSFFIPEPALWGAVIASECRLITRLPTVFTFVLNLTCLGKFSGLLVAFLLDH